MTPNLFFGAAAALLVAGFGAQIWVRSWLARCDQGFEAMDRTLRPSIQVGLGPYHLSFFVAWIHMVLRAADHHMRFSTLHPSWWAGLVPLAIWLSVLAAAASLALGLWMQSS